MEYFDLKHIFFYYVLLIRHLLKKGWIFLYCNPLFFIITKPELTS